MRARDQVGSNENKSDNADPLAEQPQQEPAVIEQPQQPKTRPEVQQTPSTPPDENAGPVSLLPCVHLIEAFFAAVTAAAHPAVPADILPATEGEWVVEPPVLPLEGNGRPAEQGAGQDVPQVETRPAAAFAVFAAGSLLFYQQDRAARTAAAEEERKTPRVLAVR